MSTKPHKPAAMPWTLILLIVLICGGVYFAQPETLAALLGDDLAAKIGLTAGN